MIFVLWEICKKVSETFSCKSCFAKIAIKIFWQIFMKDCNPEHIKWLLCSMSKFKRKVQGFITIRSIFCQIAGICMVKELNRCYLFTFPFFCLTWKGMTATHLSLSTSFMLWMHLWSLVLMIVVGRFADWEKLCFHWCSKCGRQLSLLQRFEV